MGDKDPSGATALGEMAASLPDDQRRETAQVCPLEEVDFNKPGWSLVIDLGGVDTSVRENIRDESIILRSMGMAFVTITPDNSGITITPYPKGGDIAVNMASYLKDIENLVGRDRITATAPQSARKAKDLTIAALRSAMHTLTAAGSAPSGPVTPSRIVGQPGLTPSGVISTPELPSGVTVDRGQKARAMTEAVAKIVVSIDMFLEDPSRNKLTIILEDRADGDNQITAKVGRILKGRNLPGYQLVMKVNGNEIIVEKKRFVPSPLPRES